MVCVDRLGVTLSDHVMEPVLKTRAWDEDVYLVGFLGCLMHEKVVPDAVVDLLDGGAVSGVFNRSSLVARWAHVAHKTRSCAHMQPGSRSKYGSPRARRRLEAALREPFATNEAGTIAQLIETAPARAS